MEGTTSEVEYYHPPWIKDNKIIKFKFDQQKNELGTRNTVLWQFYVYVYLTLLKRKSTYEVKQDFVHGSCCVFCSLS